MQPSPGQAVFALVGMIVAFFANEQAQKMGHQMRSFRGLEIVAAATRMSCGLKPSRNDAVYM